MSVDLKINSIKVQLLSFRECEVPAADAENDGRAEARNERGSHAASEATDAVEPCKILRTRRKH
jgi:hypothetical protein